MKIFLLVLLVVCFNIHLIHSQGKFVILHISDIQARYDETSPDGGTCYRSLRTKRKCVGGFARLQHKVNYYRELAAERKIPPVYFFLNGNIVTGTAWDKVHHWNVAVPIIESLKPTTMCFGMHEFDHGLSDLTRAAKKINVPIAATNIDISKLENNSTIVSHFTFNVQNIKVGVIGLLTVQTVLRSRPGKLPIMDEVSSASYHSKLLKERGAQMIIVIGSCGLAVDKQIADLPDVDIVISGLNKLFMYNGKPPAEEKPEYPYPLFQIQRSGKKVPIVSAYAYGKYLGYLEVSFDGNGSVLRADGNPVYLSPNTPQDDVALKFLARFRVDVDRFADQKIGTSKVPLQGSEHACGWRECNTGNLIADSLVAYTTGLIFPGKWSTTPLAMVHAGCIKSSLDLVGSGKILTRGDLALILPYENRISIIGITGANVKAILEVAVRAGNEDYTGRGEFMQVSGIRVAYDLQQREGDRVVSVKLRCGHCPVPTYEDLDVGKFYNVIIPTYIVEGHEGYSHVMSHMAHQFEFQLMESDVQIMIWYTHKESPLHPELQGRISFTKSSLEKSHSPTVFGVRFLIVVEIFMKFYTENYEKFFGV